MRGKMAVEVECESRPDAGNSVAMDDGRESSVAVQARARRRMNGGLQTCGIAIVLDFYSNSKKYKT